MINIRKYLFIKKYDLNNPEICFKKNKMTKMSKSRYKVSNPKISGQSSRAELTALSHHRTCRSAYGGSV